MTVNALRGHLSEFGLIAPKGIHRVKELLALAPGLTASLAIADWLARRI